MSKLNIPFLHSDSAVGKIPNENPINLYRLSKYLVEIARYVVLLVFTAIFLAPFMWVTFWAFKTEKEISASPFSPPAVLHWENFKRVWELGRYSVYLPNTLFYALAVVVGVCIISCLAGYALARIPFPGNQQIFIFILIGLMVPFFALMIPIYLLVRDLGILGTRIGFIIPAIALALPFGIFLMRSFFLGLPGELADAARIDGCNEFGVFSRVMLPLAYPGLATLAVFEFLWTWNMFVEPLVLVQNESLRPVGLAIFFFTGRYNIDRGMIATGVLLTILPVIVLYILLQRKFIEGITAGALK